MLKKFLAAAAAFSLTAMAQATISTALIPVFGNNAANNNVPNPVSGVAPDLLPQPFNINDGTYYTFDLVVTVDAGDDWTQSSLTGNGATIAGGVFFDHPLNLGTGSGDNPPNPGLLPLVPSLAFDSYYQSTDGTAPSYAGTNTVGSNLRRATWFSTPPNAGAGTWRVARFTVKVLPGDVGPNTILRVQGVHTTRVGQGTLFPFDVAAAIPEPSTLALLGLGGLVGLIRRR